LRGYVGTRLTLSDSGTAETIAAVAATLNAKPRKNLCWKTTAEAIDQWLAQENTGVATTA
jgi:IS30 family transposase